MFIPECTVSLSLFADPERVFRRFSVFAEEPRKSTITAIEPCSPVFKDAQPRPSKQNTQSNSHSVEFESLIVVHNVFLMLDIYHCNKASNWIVPKQKEWVSSGYPSHQKWVDISPYTHAHHHMRTSRTFCIFAVPRGGYTPSLVENLMSRGRRRTNSGSSVADCVHTVSFQNIRENRVPCNTNQIQGEVPTHGSQICIYSKKK